MSDEKKEKKDNGGLEDVARKAIEIAKSVAAEVRKLKEQLVNEGVISNPAATMSGAEAYRMKGKSGHVKVTALVGVAMLFAVITGGLFAANELVWKVGDSAYVDAEGDAYFNGVTTVNGVVDTRLSALEGGAFTCTTITTNAYPITSANYSTMILVNTNAAVAITLPANGAAAGSWVDVAVHSSATDACAPTIATATADTLVIINGIDGDSVTYGTGHRIGAYARFWSDGSFWHYVNMGPTTLTENDSD